MGPNFLLIPLFDPLELEAVEGAPVATDDRSRAAKARRLYRFRTRRSRHLPAELIGEPGWDILLLAYFLGDEGRQVAVGDLVNGCGCSPTTGLRWVALLEKRGLFERTPDPSDRRRQYIALSAAGKSMMDALLDEHL